MIKYIKAPITYDRERIFRRLHIEHDTYAYDYSIEHFDILEDMIDKHLDIINCYIILDEVMHFNIIDIDECTKQIVCLSSCTDKIIHVIEDMIKQGDFLEGYILNDMANDIIFNASNYMNQVIQSHMEDMGCHLTKRYSPGEGNMPIRFQKDLLAYFDDPRLSHIYLTESYMLSPEKSMLYIFGADIRKPIRSVRHSCDMCNNKTCFFRTSDGENYFCE